MFRLAWLEYSVLLPIAALGLLCVRDSKVRGFFLLAALGTFTFTCLDGILDIFVYLIPTYYVLSITLGVSFEWLTSRCRDQYVSLLKLSFLCLPLLFLSSNVRKADQSQNVDAKVLVEQSLQAVGEKALIVCPNYEGGRYFWHYVFAEGYGQQGV
jgi:hypothetical protein